MHATAYLSKIFFKTNVVKSYLYILYSNQCRDVLFSSFFSGGFITAIVVNPPERKLAKLTSVQWAGMII